MNIATCSYLRRKQFLFTRHSYYFNVPPLQFIFRIDFIKKGHYIENNIYFITNRKLILENEILI